jgi:hypothetical protein
MLGQLLVIIFMLVVSLITNQLTPRIRVFRERLIVTQIVETFFAFYGTQRFITVLTTARPWTLS